MQEAFYSNAPGAVPPPPAGRPPQHAYRDDDDSEASDPRYRPSAMPPAGSPPTPPATPPAWKNKTEVKTDYGTGGGGGVNVHASHNSNSASNGTSFRGDASLRPNVGLTNSYEYALFGWTLQELVINLRTGNLVATALTLLWIPAAWLAKLITFQISNSVLLGYLAVLSLALFLVDLMGFYRTQLSDRGITTHTFIMEERIRDKLGLLYHPGGKAFYLFFLVVLCWHVGGLWLRLISCLYLFSAFGYLYAYNTYPEYRRGDAPRSSASSASRGMWTKQAWTTTSLSSGRGLAEAAARNWSSRWGVGTGPEEEPGETDSFLRHSQANQTYVYV